MADRPLRMTIDTNAVGLILDAKERRPLATGFVFLRSNWIVTAKHVVEPPPGCRSQWRDVHFRSRSGFVPARVFAASPETDVCILSLQGPAPCNRPLMPGNETLVTASGFVFAGYAPSKTTTTGPAILVCRAMSYGVQERERSSIERVLEFDTNEMERGFSGGPVLGEGGSVVGLLIQIVPDTTPPRGRATSIDGILGALRIDIAPDWKVPEGAPGQ